MRIRYSFSILLCYLLFVGFRLSAQVAISNSTNPPNSSAMLDIQSTNKGLLLPRIDFNNVPANPATGLLFYITANGPFGNGLYIYDGVGWRMLGSSTFYLEQHTGGGIVFYVDPTGHHGLIAAPDDQGWEHWGCDSTLIGPAAQHFEIMTGDLNTAAIVAMGCPQPYKAAVVCDTLTLGGYTDWFLPSNDEMDSMLVHRDAIGGFDPSWSYWTSTETDTTHVYVKINDPAWFPGYNLVFPKSYDIKIRCVRKF